MSDTEEFMCKAFPVNNLLTDTTPLNPNEAPADAIQYLRLVALEASKCDDVVVAKIDESKLKKQTVVYQLEDKPSSSLAPSREWKVCQVSDFSDLRLHLAKLRHVKTPSVELPDRGDEWSWCTFCLGSQFADQMPCEMRGRRKSAREGVNQVVGNPPLLSIICAMNQPTVEQVLEFQVSWLENVPTFSTEQGRWLYALLVGLEQPLTPDICSLLRTLARTCACKRDELAGMSNVDSETQSLITALNLLICLVSLYFRQLDLEDL